MKRIFGAYAYGSGPREGCWWDETISIAPRPRPRGDIRVDVAIIGAGFTGLVAALDLAENGARVAVFEANRLGWGASGRNGGFCCLGGGIASDAELDAQYGKDARLAFRRAEKAAVCFVDDLTCQRRIDIDRHSAGETELAHRPRDMLELRRQAENSAENYGVETQLMERAELAGHGLQGGPFHGAATIPIGFALNPCKYLSGLAESAESAGARIFENAQVQRLERSAKTWMLDVSGCDVRADQVIIATNGYSSEGMPEWIGGRFMPAQSTVLVTRPLTDAEIAAQGWSSDQMCYDTRRLLHYFRLMPDRRFLFGMRGGLLTGARAEARSRAALQRHFERMFPAWVHVPATHSWSGMVSLARRKVPYVGPVPEEPGLWTAMCYHGNGVAMGSYCGSLISGRLRNSRTEDCPEVLRKPLAKFPFGAWRRVLMPPLYASLALQDR